MDVDPNLSCDYPLLNNIIIGAGRNQNFTIQQHTVDDRRQQLIWKVVLDGFEGHPGVVTMGHAMGHWIANLYVKFVSDSLVFLTSAAIPCSEDIMVAQDRVEKELFHPIKCSILHHNGYVNPGCPNQGPSRPMQGKDVNTSSCQQMMDALSIRNNVDIEAKRGIDKVQSGIDGSLIERRRMAKEPRLAVDHVQRVIDENVSNTSRPLHAGKKARRGIDLDTANLGMIENRLALQDNGARRVIEAVQQSIDVNVNVKDYQIWE